MSVKRRQLLALLHVKQHDPWFVPEGNLESDENSTGPKELVATLCAAASSWSTASTAT
jgi:hypothetical protein